MPGVGVGGFLSNLINPGLDDQIAAAVTPNPNPLAQQGQGAPATSGSPTLPNAAATKMDPYVGNLAGMLLKRDRQAQLAADFNNNLGSIAAGFGTREQQASKQAALRGGGGAGGGIGDVGDIMKIQQAVTDQNEHARFMANMSVLAKILFPGDPEGVAKATEVANNSGILTQFGQTAATNATAPQAVKEADAATAAWKEANPNASPQDIAQFKSNLLSNAALGGDSKAREYMQAKQAWFNDPANKGKPVPPELATQAAFEQNQAAGITTSVTAAKDLVADQHNYAPAAQTIDQQIADAKSLLASPAFGDIYGNPINAGKNLDGPTAALLSDETKRALALNNKLVSGQYTSQIQDMHGMGRITQMEMEKGSPAQSIIAKRTISPETARQGWNDWITKMETKKANFAGAAGQLYQLSDEEYKLVNPMYKPGGDMYVSGQPPRQESPSQSAPTSSVDAPQTAIDHLKAHPELAPAFDAKYGPGASKKILGQ